MFDNLQTSPSGLEPEMRLSESRVISFSPWGQTLRGGIQTPNVGFEDRNDIHFTTRATSLLGFEPRTSA